jgi:hypothetical protein
MIEGDLVNLFFFHVPDLWYLSAAFISNLSPHVAEAV